MLTSQVKGRLTQNKEVGANHVKVVTENGTVFLMGLVTRAEAEAAAQTAATTGGAQSVVKVSNTPIEASLSSGKKKAPARGFFHSGRRGYAPLAAL